MRIELDRNRCEGHGMCEVVAPKFFAVQDDGSLTILSEEISDTDESQLHDAAIACPVNALRLT
ncbi:ferredoxin [Mycobacterium sp. pR1184]|uniref:ferredoxin n=1 Tax=Mycobacterium sp. pR1184 TaxID=3238981 RepID=UPI00351B63DE